MSDFNVASVYDEIGRLNYLREYGILFHSCFLAVQYFKFTITVRLK